MHFPKLLALLSLTVLAAGTIHAQKPDSDLQSKAREALHQAEAGTAPVASAPASVLKPAEMKPIAQAAPPAAAAAAATPAPAAVKTLSPEEEAKVRAQLHSAMQEMDAQQKGTATAAAPQSAPPPPAKPKPATPPPAATAPAAAKPAVVTAPPAAKPIPAAVAPPPSAELTQDQKLKDLLEEYKADKITPQEYHARRMQILGSK